MKKTGVLLAVAVLLLGLGCGGAAEKQEPRGEGGNGEVAVEQGGGGEGHTSTSSRAVHMCGRSVLGGWFDHWGWGWDPADPASFHGYSMYYHEMESPPGIADTARGVIEDLADKGGGTVFFKLCFADFEGGDRDNAEANLERNQEIVRAVVDAAVEAGNVFLLLGNALPLVREYCDQWLVDNQRRYNAFLEGLAESHPGRIVVLDLYGTLAASGGWLKPEYAADPYDSHLNDAAYRALDPVLEKALSALESG